jgi:hypothetical protein
MLNIELESSISPTPVKNTAKTEVSIEQICKKQKAKNSKLGTILFLMILITLVVVLCVYLFDEESKIVTSIHNNMSNFYKTIFNSSSSSSSEKHYYDKLSGRISEFRGSVIPKM